MTAIARIGGCGCGGNPGSGGGCGGGSGGGTGGVGGTGGFVRPRFFAGMLLAEDDLQAVDDYVVGKRKLTNRALFGPGVVCGLDVSCAPCDPRSVVVAPGYALDCCGNDIVVECATTVDAVTLLRELRQRTGQDCGEPCEENPKKDYWLVARYTEQPSDPMAPYQQDDCVVGDCEFSRVREGYVLELSATRPGTPPSLIDRLEQCVKEAGDREPDVRAMTEAVELAALHSRITERVAAGRVPDAAAPRKADFDRLSGDAPAPVAAVSLLSRATLALAADAARRAGDASSAGLTDAAKAALTDRRDDLAARLLKADEVSGIASPEGAQALRVLSSVTGPGAGDLTPADRWWLAEGWTPDAAAVRFRAAAGQVRTAVLRDLRASGRGNCAEHREVEALSLDRLDDRSVAAAERLGSAFLRGLGRCLCDLANPPCPSCTDLRVPLAAVRIEGCEVISVCDLDRDWIVSPRAFAYWLPVVEVLRRVLLARCCPGGDERPPRDTELAVLIRLATQLGELVRAPQDDPRLHTLIAAMGQATQADPLRAGAAPAPQPVPPQPVPAQPASAAPGPAPSAPAAADAARIQALEDKITALVGRLDALTAGGGGQP